MKKKVNHITRRPSKPVESLESDLQKAAVIRRIDAVLPDCDLDFVRGLANWLVKIHARGLALER